MTDLLFGNNNHRIVYKLAKRSISSNKIRNIFVVSAIFLSTLLITTIFSIGISFMETSQKQLVNMVGTLADAGINSNKLIAEQLAKAKTLDYVKGVGIQNAVATIENKSEWGKKTQLYLFDYDETEWSKFREPVYSDIEGNYPQAYNEIMVPVSMLDYMGIESPEIGMEIPIEYLYGADRSTLTAQTFILSGYFTEYVIEGQSDYGLMIISNQFAQKCYQENPKILGQISFQFTGNANIQDNIFQLEQDLSLQSGSIQATLPISNGGISSVVGLGVFIVFIMLVGYLLIYNVLYISVSNDIRFYGLLKAIGATSKQIQKIVVYQALVLSVIGIPLGIVLGGILSLILVPMVMESSVLQVQSGASANPFIFIGAGLFSLVTVIISTHKPALIASKITPIAAMRYIEATSSKKRIRTTSGGKLTIMAWRNVFRTKKRAITVLISLSLGIIVFLVTSTVLASMDLKNFVDASLEHDYDLQNLTTNKDLEDGNVEKFTAPIIEEIQNLPGIHNINIITTEKYSVPYDEDKFSKHIDDYLLRFPYYTSKKSDYGHQDLSGVLLGIDRSVVDEFNKRSTTSIDVEAFLRGDIVLVETDNPEHFDNVNEMLITIKATGEQIEIPIGGFIPWDYQDTPTPGGSPSLYVAKEVLQKWSPEARIMKVIFDIDEAYTEDASKKIAEIFLNDPDVSIISKVERMNQAGEQSMFFSILGGGLSVILAIIGILNFLNIMITSIITRKREFAMLESIGMTKKQIKRMLQYEGLIYAILSLIIVISIGSGIIVGAFLLLKQMASYAVFCYPILPFIISSILIIIICLTTPVIVQRMTSGKSIVERLRVSE